MTQPVERWNAITRSVWNAFDPDAETSEAAARTACIVRLIVLTLQKPQQVAGMTVRSVDLDNRLWLVSASSPVGGHILPLTPRAAHLIRTALALRNDPGSPWVFQDRGRARIGDIAIHRHFNARMRMVRPFETVRLNNLRHIGRMLLASPPLKLEIPSLCNLLGHEDRVGVFLGDGSEVYRLHDKRRTLARWEKQVSRITDSKLAVATPPRRSARFRDKPPGPVP